MRSALIHTISAGSTIVTHQEIASWKAIDSAEHGGTNQDPGENKYDERTFAC